MGYHNHHIIAVKSRNELKNQINCRNQCFAVTSSFILHQLCLLGGLNLYVQAYNPWLSSLQ